MPVNDKDLLRLRGIPGGINNVAREDSLPRNEDGIATAVREAVNVDINDAGKFARRPGYMRVRNLTRGHSGFGGWAEAMLLVDNGSLIALTGDDPEALTATTLRTGMADAVSYAAVNLDCYYTDGRVLRRLTEDMDDLPAAPSCPAQPTVAAYASGGLYAGTYQVAVTNLAANGTESGSTLATLVDVPAGGGIELSNLVADAEATHLRVYLTDVDGEVLYWRRDIPVGVPSWVIGVSVPGKAIETQFCVPLRPGHILRRFKGRLYCAHDNILGWSEALRYGLTRGDNYLRVGKRISMFEPVEDGCYVAANDPTKQGGGRTLWLAGNDPKAWQQALARATGAVEGTGCSVPAEWFKLPVKGEVAFWVDTQGVMCLGLPGGQIQPVTEDRVAMPVNALRGAVLLNRRSGIRQVIAALLGGTANLAAASDSAVATIRKHGDAADL